MSKRAEERGLEAVPPRWRKTKDGKGRVDSALPVRKFYIRAYEHAEKDLALTWEDIQRITDIHRDVLFENPKRIMFSKENYEDTLVRFNKLREMLNPNQY